MYKVISKRDVGKEIRMSRIMNISDGRMIMIPLDHGIVGTVKGIENPTKTIEKVVSGGADSVLFNIGLTSSVYQSYIGKCGAIYNLTNAVTDKKKQTLLSSVEQAIRLGADAVSVQITLGSPFEDQMISNYKTVYDACSCYGIPLLLMSYFNKEVMGERTWTHCITQTARVGAELGADIVKISYPGSKEALIEVVNSCPIPIVVAGGEKKDSVNETLEMVYDSIEAGAVGVAMGRNVWQYKEPEKLVKSLNAIIHKGKSVEEAKRYL